MSCDGHRTEGTMMDIVQSGIAGVLVVASLVGLVIGIFLGGVFERRSIWNFDVPPAFVSILLPAVAPVLALVMSIIALSSNSVTQLVWSAIVFGLGLVFQLVLGLKLREVEARQAREMQSWNRTGTKAVSDAAE